LYALQCFHGSCGINIVPLIHGIDAILCQYNLIIGEFPMAHAAPLTNEALAVLNTSRSLPLLAVASVSFAACVTKWATRRRTRQTLENLENWQLGDVGLTPSAARRETKKVFWQA
jgi:uncharacterized protein YjiS (DUF1127 family)